MIISIDKETGTPMFMLDQLLLNPKLKDCYHHFGLHGIHYAILFGWTGSPYRSKLDEEERDDIAYVAVKATELFDTKKDKIVKPDKLMQQMYKNVFMRHAIATINELAKIPILEQKYFFQQEVEFLKKQLNTMLNVDKDPTLAKKQIDTRKVIIDSIKSNLREVENIDAKIETMFRIERIPSLNDLIELASA